MVLANPMYMPVQFFSSFLYFCFHEACEDDLGMPPNGKAEALVLLLFIVITRVGQNHIYTMYIRCFSKGGYLGPKMGMFFACS